MDNEKMLIAIQEMLKAELAPVQSDIKKINVCLNSMETRLDTMGTRLDTMGTRLDTMESDMNARFDKVDEKLEFLSVVLEGTLQIHDKLDQRVKHLEDIA